MSIKLTVVSHKGRELPASFDFVFEHGTFTIGRSQSDGFVLHDPDLLVSRGHASIWSHENEYILQNQKPNNFTVVNGNYLQNNESTSLRDGDVIEIGEYRITVTIERHISVPQEILPEQIGSEEASPSAVASSEDEKWWEKYIFPGSSQVTPPAEAKPPAQRQQSEIKNDGDVRIDRSQPPLSSDRPDPSGPYPDITASQNNSFIGHVGDQHGLKHFLYGLGILPKDIEILCGENDPQILYQYGQVLRSALLGLSEVLIARQIFKTNLSIDRTHLSAVQNNALKVVPDINQALALMIKGDNKAYLPLDASVEDAITDIKAHQMALMAGLKDAIAAVIEEFNPEKLEESLRGAFFLQRKAKYWELFKEQYAKIARDAEDNFIKVVGKEFAEAYLRQTDNIRYQHANMKREKK